MQLSSNRYPPFMALTKSPSCNALAGYIPAHRLSSLHVHLRIAIPAFLRQCITVLTALSKLFPCGKRKLDQAVKNGC